MIRVVLDATGAEWDVRSERETSLGFGLLFGRPSAERNSDGRAGAAVIITADLLSYLESRRNESTTETAAQLGIGRSTLTRLRREAGHNRYADLSAWWTARLTDLQSLTLEQFSEKHGTTIGSTERWRLILVGKVIRDEGWHLDESVVEALESAAPASHVGAFLGGIPVGTVGALRSKLSAKGIIKREGTTGERIAESKRGIPVPEQTRKALKAAAKRKKSPAHRRRIAMGLAKFHRENPGVAAENFGFKPWTPEEESVLGTATDREIAKRIDRTIPSIRSRRAGLGIPAFRPGWSMPVPRSDAAKKMANLVRRRFQSISGAVRATGIKYKRLWNACDGRKPLTDQTIDSILAVLKATRSDLEEQP